MNASLSARALRLLVVFLLTFASGSAFAAGSGAIISRVSGAVKISVNGQPVPASNGAELDLPARIETGTDGSLRVEQASSTLDIGPNSVVVLPAAGGASEKIRQNLGRVLYSVKPRKSRSFSVETPYLVSVVKGTMFSVAIDANSTEVSLLEGSVELIADGVNAVMLQPHETARHGAGDRSINVTKVDTTAPTSPQADARALSPVIATPTNVTLPMSDATLADLREIASARRDAVVATTTPTDDTAAPSAPESPTSPQSPMPPDGAPSTPTTPSSPSTPTPPSTPETPATPTADPIPTPAPTPSDDDDCRRKKCDGDDDDRGHGNDDKDKG